MGKQQKTKQELEALIRERLGVQTSVQPHATYEWDAKAITVPRLAFDVQQRVDEVVRELRGQFSLKT